MRLSEALACQNQTPALSLGVERLQSIALVWLSAPSFRLRGPEANYVVIEVVSLIARPSKVNEVLVGEVIDEITKLIMNVPQTCDNR
jgi:hypothetical protein